MSVIDIFDLRGANPILRAFNPPRIASAVADLRSKFIRYQVTSQIQLLGRTYGVTNVSVPIGSVPCATVVEIAINGQDATLALDERFLKIFEHTTLQSRSGRDLRENEIALVVEHLLSSEIATFEERYGVDVEIKALRRDVPFPTDQIVLALEIALGKGVAFEAYLCADDPEILEELIHRNFEQKPPNGSAALRFKVACVGPIAQMPSKDVMAVSAGDVLDLSDEWVNLETHLHLIVKDEYIAPLKAVKGGCVIDGPDERLSTLKAQFLDGEKMKISDTDQSSSIANPSSTITVELIRAELTAAQLSNIQNGDILDLDIESVKVVRLCADGTPFAEGLLVQLDETLGVQVTELL